MAPSTKRAIIPDGFLAPGTLIDDLMWTGVPSGWKLVFGSSGTSLYPIHAHLQP